MSLEGGWEDVGDEDAGDEIVHPKDMIVDDTGHEATI
jgi:hypothetical protein